MKPWNASLRRGLRLPSLGFTLLEVLLAVAVLAGTIAVVLAMLPGLIRQDRGAVARLQAQRLPDALTVELHRLSGAGLAALASRIPVMGTPLQGGLPFAATRAGAAVTSLDYLSPALSEQIEPAAQYFLLECWRFPDAPLRFADATPSLALYVRVSWPYHLPGGTASEPVIVLPRERSQLTFTVVLPP